MPEKPPSPSNFPTPLQGWLGSEGAESSDKPRFATVGPSRKSGRPRHQAREMPPPVCGRTSEPAATPAPSRESDRPLVGSQEAPAREAGHARSPFRWQDLGRELCELHHKLALKGREGA